MIPRTLTRRLAELARQFPVIFLTGPRQSGKTTLARSTFPEFRYLSLEETHTRNEAVNDPRGFLKSLEAVPGAILDEAQRAPDLFSHIQGFADDRRGGPLVLTGSQHFLMSERISQSLAGRAAILELYPLSTAELLRREARRPDDWAQPGAGTAVPSVTLEELMFKGLFPRLHAEDVDAAAWLDDYARAYVERDVRQLHNIGDLDTFRRFLELCAGRAGNLLNTSSLGSDAGVSNVTARTWLSVLQESYVVHLLRPHHTNFNKRIVRSPKLYFTDTGLLCHLLGVREPQQLRAHPLRGAIFENFVVAELLKVFSHAGERPRLYFWRDVKGHEVDVLIDLGLRLIPVEIKAGATVAGDFLDGLERFAKLSGCGSGVLVYGGDESYTSRGHTVRPWWDCG